MKILVTGATGYIGAAVADALLARGHQVHGLARSPQSAALLRSQRIQPVMGDFAKAASLTEAVRTSDPQAIISTASVGSLGGDASTYARDRDALSALRDGLGDSGKTLIFTSGSAVFGSFNGGDGTDAVYTEDADLPLPDSIVTPASAHVHPMLAAGLSQAMRARVQTERVVIGAHGVRGIVVRPGLVYGRGGSFDIPALIRMSRRYGGGVHLGSGGTTQSYIHIDDLAQLFCLAVEKAPSGAILHGVTDDITQRQMAAAVGRLIGAGSQTQSLTMEQMLGLRTAERIGLRLTASIPPHWVQRLQGPVTPPDGVGTGISLCLNKRLSSEKTGQLLAFAPTRTDILDDIEFGSYARTA